jgi:hypothetical protein
VPLLLLSSRFFGQCFGSTSKARTVVQAKVGWMLDQVQHDRQPAVPLEECPLGHGRPNIVIPADAGIQPTFLLSILWISHGRV